MERREQNGKRRNERPQGQNFHHSLFPLRAKNGHSRHKRSSGSMEGNQLYSYL